MRADDRALLALPYIDNPANEDRWGDAKGIADRAGLPRRGMAQTLDMLARQGLVESKGNGLAPGPRSDPAPRLYRRRRTPR
jgi:DNA-binding IscR family transcriptional regulator